MPNYDTQNRKDLEEAVLGSILIDSDRGLKEIVLKHGLDQPEFFIEEMHQKIFYCILRCWEKNEKVDLISITKYKYEKVKSNSADSKLFDFKSIQVSQKNLQMNSLQNFQIYFYLPCQISLSLVVLGLACRKFH